MKINKDIDLAVLLDYGWKSSVGRRNSCYKSFNSTDNAIISLVINPIVVKQPFVINSYYENNGGYRDDSCVDMFEILEEIEFLKKLNILIK